MITTKKVLNLILLGLMGFMISGVSAGSRPKHNDKRNRGGQSRRSKYGYGNKGRRNVKGLKNRSPVTKF